MAESPYEYIRCRKGDTVPPYAVPADGEDKRTHYFARGLTKHGHLLPGKVEVESPGSRVLGKAFISYNQAEYELDNFEILTSKSVVNYVSCRPGGRLPEGAIEAGFCLTRAYHARGKYNDCIIPGKVLETTHYSTILDSLSIPYEGKECSLDKFEVLTIADKVFEFDEDMARSIDPRPTLRATTKRVKRRSADQLKVTNSSSLEDQSGSTFRHNPAKAVGNPTISQKRKSSKEVDHDQGANQKRNPKIFHNSISLLGNSI